MLVVCGLFVTLFSNLVVFHRWMDGDFLELNGETMEAEVDEFFREIYRMSKQFQQKEKKMQQESKKILQPRTKEEKKEETKESPTVSMCSSILVQIKDFKVRKSVGY